MKFKDIGIPVGAELESSNNKMKGLKVAMHDLDDSVEYDGEVYHLSDLYTELVNDGKRHNGFRHFKYKGKTLSRMRREKTSS